MSLSEPRSVRHLCLWLLLSTTAQYANPLGDFGWPELIASTGPLVLGLDRRIRPVPTAAFGVGLIAVVTLIARGSTVVFGTFVPPICFAVGIALAARAFGSSPASGRPRGGWATLDPTPAARDAFAVRLERELGRARRYEKILVLLSVAPSAANRSAGESRRALLAIGNLLSRELRIYSDGLIDGGRVLALVPEVERETLGGFLKRVRTILEQRLDFAVQIGFAVFPTDALCSDDLVETADLARERGAEIPVPTGPRADDPALANPRASRRADPS